MNMKETVQKDFLKLQKVLRELRFLRYNYLRNAENKRRIEESIKLLGPMSDELKAKIENMTRSTGDYDI